jgi:hypothetical protein
MEVLQISQDQDRKSPQRLQTSGNPCVTTIPDSRKEPQETATNGSQWNQQRDQLRV